jgi:SigmaW regulon antibacterial
MAEAFRNGNLGIMDYYKMKNIMADTSMRETIARPEKNNQFGGFFGGTVETVPLFSYIRCRIELYHCNIPEPEARSPGCGLKSRLP